MTTHDNKSLVKTSTKFYCETCDYTASRKYNYELHLNSIKHKNNGLTTNVPSSLVKISKTYNCQNCEKQFNDRAGLWRHNKKCSQIQDNENYEPKKDDSKKDDLIDYLIKENQEFKNLILELAKKDSSVINNIKMQLTDLENFGDFGYVEGVSRVLIKNLKELDMYSRPIHCSDLKREVLYIKDNNEWTKETDDKPVLKNMIKQVANKNIKQIQTWKAEYPDCIYSDSKKNDQYMNIVMNSMSGGTSEEQQNNLSQIVKNVTKAVVIDKKTN